MLRIAQASLIRLVQGLETGRVVVGTHLPEPARIGALDLALVRARLDAQMLERIHGERAALNTRTMATANIAAIQNQNQRTSPLR
ncbi:hypothetical protein D3C71_1811500 [compost metagenome]